MYETHKLSNGLRIIHYRSTGESAFCGLMINVGSRDERDGEDGLAHFIEHIIFKGTKKRKAYHVLSRMEDVGGEINAFTTKEDTCIYSNFLAKDYDRALELFSDIVFNSVFPDKEIEKEKDVVIDEINSYKDSPIELIYDDFEELIYSGFPIGRNILGKKSDVKKITRKAVMKFIEMHYKPQNMVISSVGNIEFSKLIRIVEKNFGGVGGGDVFNRRIKPVKYKPVIKEVNKSTHQIHCVLGNVAYDYTQAERLPLSMLVNLLGGSAMNSRLSLNVREKYGLVYNIEAGYTPYSDTGIFNIYFGCDEEDYDKCIIKCKEEMMKLCDAPLSETQLRKLKKQTYGQLAISSENYENLMLSIGKSYMIYDKVDDIKEIYEHIRALDANLLHRVANEIFNIEMMSILKYK